MNDNNQNPEHSEPTETDHAAVARFNEQYRQLGAALNELTRQLKFFKPGNGGGPVDLSHLSAFLEVEQSVHRLADATRHLAGQTLHNLDAIGLRGEDKHKALVQIMNLLTALRFIVTDLAEWKDCLQQAAAKTKPEAPKPATAAIPIHVKPHFTPN